MNEPKRHVAKLVCFNDLVMNDQGSLSFSGYFQYTECGGCQQIQRKITETIILSLMRVFNVTKFSQLNGQICIVTHTDDKIIKIEPLFPDEGQVFNLEK